MIDSRDFDNIVLEAEMVFAEMMSEFERYWMGNRQQYMNGVENGEIHQEIFGEDGGNPVANSAEEQYNNPRIS